MDIYLAVDKEVSDAQNVTLSGKFLSKAYEGDFKNTGTWGQDFENFVKEKGLQVRKLYMWYTTCPKCAKKYGKNYVVFIAEVD
jgi:endo-beta-N-acetylglucosaminidase D